jgi:hypothetical protein
VSCVNAFAKKYKCKMQVTTFNTMDEALSCRIYADKSIKIAPEPD